MTETRGEEFKEDLRKPGVRTTGCPLCSACSKPSARCTVPKCAICPTPCI